MIRTILFLLCGFVVTTASVQAQKSEYKLQPLSYNHPGLEVDLGVGLWAFPIPLDYDDDGDMDLLVSCPDKPSNGVYFFENPTQDPSVTMPVFKAGVRIGPGNHFMLMSHLNGDAVVLRQNNEFRRDPSTGEFDFSAPKKIDARVNPIDKSKGRTRGIMSRYVDFDGDGDHDLAVGIGDWTDLGWDHAYDNHGEWRNGPLHGYVYVTLNNGTDENPKYAKDGFRVRAGGGDVDVYGWPCPNFADFDNDGDLDLLCGEFMDGFTYFQNTGSRTDPVYAAGIKLNNAEGEPLAMHLQMITPTAVDWDQDGDLDLVVGDEDGRVALVENTGRRINGTPVFNAPKYFRQVADTLKFGALATPYVYDWDNDGDDDILCGNTAGSIGWFENVGAGQNGLPKWNAPKLLNVKTTDGEEPFRVMAGENGSIQGPCEAKWGYTTMSVADWDGDGDGDIIYNSILGRIGLLINDGGVLNAERFDAGSLELPSKWYWWQTPASDTLSQWRTTPVAIDFDKDDKLDLVMLDQEGFLTLRRSGKSAERIFLDEDGNEFRVNSGSAGRSGRIKLEVVDWDGDGRLDVLTNSENATWYRNSEDRDGKVVLKRVGNLARRNVAGHTSSPAACDFDGDGTPDLLVGSENGRIYHIAHNDCVQFSKDQLGLDDQVVAKPARIPGLITEEFVYDKAPFKQCHASTICETSRGLVASWFGGSKEGQKDVGIWTSYHDGQGWSSPIQVADGVQHESLRYPCWNPVLFQPPGDAPTLLFFKVGPNPREWWGEMMVSYDRGRTFRDRKRLPESIDGPVRCKPILIDDDQTLLCGGSTEHDGWRVHFESVSLVDGMPSGPWKRIGPINDASVFNAIQPTFLQHTDGRLEVLCRTREGVIAASVSTDQGASWSELKSTGLPNPNSGIESVTLRDGRHLLVYNHIETASGVWGKRGELNLAISDNGIDWKQVAVLEQEKKAEFSYPAMIQSSDGHVHITYTHKRRKIKHLEFDPSQFVEVISD